MKKFDLKETKKAIKMLDYLLDGAEIDLKNSCDLKEPISLLKKLNVKFVIDKGFLSLHLSYKNLRLAGNYIYSLYEIKDIQSNHSKTSEVKKRKF